MAVKINAPQFPESVEEGTLMTWHKAEGESVRRDEKIAEIETDKIVLEVAAPDSGMLTGIRKREGDAVKAGEVLASLEAGKKGGDKPDKKAVSAETRKDSGPANEPVRGKPGDDATDEVAAGPAARKLLEEHGLKASDVIGAGQAGRITREDVVQFLEKRKAEDKRRKKAASKSSAKGRPEERAPMTRIRARIADRLVEAQQTAAILTTFNEVNMAPVREARNRHREEFEKEYKVKLGYMSFFVKASAEALKRFPILNASVDGQDIIYHGFYDIGIAVSTDRGLVVPILRDADQMTFAEIEQAILDYSTRAAEGRLTIEELTGGTFSITNGGVFGSLWSTPILNPPQSAILGMHTIHDRPVAENGKVVIRPMMYLALSYDHRIVDGREAVLFLAQIRELLEDPARLLLQV